MVKISGGSVLPRWPSEKRWSSNEHGFRAARKQPNNTVVHCSGGTTRIIAYILGSFKLSPFDPQFS